jgi:hypothetical protein
MRAHVDLDAVVAFYRKLGMAVTWKMPDAVFMAWGGYRRYVAFSRWPLPRQKGALAAAYTPGCLGRQGIRWGWSSSRLGKNYQVRTILASAAYS